MIPGPSFRTDINGLRAWAVALVLLFHFQVTGFDGGFVGVDVFFVISGYLMTSIILGDRARGEFSLTRFYLARALRIVPALAVLCAVLLLAGWFWLSATDYMALATQVATSLGFVSNLQFWSESGYFDAASHEKWLLHTWSLSVEAQFYVLYPLLLLGLGAWSKDPARLRRAMLVITALSLVACVLVSHAKPASAFFLLPPRAWQLLAGGLVYVYADRLVVSSRAQPWLERLGLALVVLAGVVFHARLSWPGAWALLPVAGTALVLIAARSDSLLTSSAAVQWLGQRSYSLYLWHWPIVVALHYLQLQYSALALVAGAAAALVMSDLSFRFVETLPRLRRNQAASRRSWIYVAAAVLTPVAFAMHVVNQSGVPGRMPELVDLAARESSNMLSQPSRCMDDPARPVGSTCIYGGDDVVAILVGDSHALAIASALEAAAPGPESGVLALLYPSCPTILTANLVPGTLISGHRCYEFNQWLTGALGKFPSSVPAVLVSRTSVYIDGLTEPGQRDRPRPPLHFGTEVHRQVTQEYLDEFAEQLVASACALAQHRAVFLVRPIPEMPVNVPKTVSRAFAMGRPIFPTLSAADYARRHAVVMAAQDRARDECGIRILDPRPALCPEGPCVSVVGNRPLYYDDDHLSEFGNKLLVPMFREVFDGAPD